MITQTNSNAPVSRSSARGSAEAVAPRHDLSNHFAALLRHVLGEQRRRELASYAVGMTSCEKGEGVTTVSVNLAATAARSGSRRVLLMDANADHSGPTEMMNIPPGPGLTDVLAGKAMLGDCIASTTVEGMDILLRGQEAGQIYIDYELADVASLMDELKTEYDLIVVDLPAANELNESYAFADVVDGIYLIFESGQTDRRMAGRVKDRLEKSKADLLGAICNKHPAS